jgi:hypothetical protein
VLWGLEQGGGKAPRLRLTVGSKKPCHRGLHGALRDARITRLNNTTRESVAQKRRLACVRAILTAAREHDSQGRAVHPAQMAPSCEYAREKSARRGPILDSTQVLPGLSQ